MAQRKLDHLAQRVDRVAHAAEIVVGNVGAALSVAFLIFWQQLDLRGRVDVDDALGRRSDHHQPHFLQREGGRVEHLPDFFRHVGINPLVAGGGNDIALHDGPAGEAALQRGRRTLQPDIVLRRCEDNPRRRLRLRLLHLDIIAGADPRV